MQVPSEYFLLVLGKHLKYSSCLYPSSSTTLDEAEEAMLGLSSRRLSADQAAHTSCAIASPVARFCNVGSRPS